MSVCVQDPAAAFLTPETLGRLPRLARSLLKAIANLRGAVDSLGPRLLGAGPDAADGLDLGRLVAELMELTAEWLHYPDETPIDPVGPTDARFRAAAAVLGDYLEWLDSLQRPGESLPRLRVNVRWGLRNHAQLLGLGLLRRLASPVVLGGQTHGSAVEASVRAATQLSLELLRAFDPEAAGDRRQAMDHFRRAVRAQADGDLPALISRVGDEAALLAADSGRSLAGVPSRQALPAQEPDGPFDVCRFRWAGRTPFGLAPRPWHLINYLWRCPGRAADESDVLEEVWGGDAGGGALDNAKTRANKEFAKNDCPLRVYSKAGRVFVCDDSLPENSPPP